MPSRESPGLIGRDAELAALGQVLDAVRAGDGRTLVLRGPPGVRKSALLEALAERASGCRVAHAAGVESEMELPFAGLHQLCGPLLDQLDRLPRPQRDALGTAFGLSAGIAPDRFLVGLAVLSLLSDVAQDRPLVCLVDDAHWLDRASAQMLAFVARRLLADAVALVFAARPEHGLTGLPELGGGYGRPDALPVAGQIEHSFEQRLATLPEDSRLLLLLAAADPTGDPALLWRAAGALEVGVEAASAAGLAELCEFGGRVRFRHPLVRSAVYRAASPESRWRAHRALAEATDPDADPDRRGWHRAHATTGLDEDVAAELERSAGRAQTRGGAAAAAAFLERAAQLTPAPDRRARRALAAAQAKHQAGAFEAARDLLAVADTGPPDARRRALSDLLRGQIAFASDHGSDAPPLLLSAARGLEPFAAELARDTYLEAFAATLFAGRMIAADRVRELAEAALAAPSDLLLQGLARSVLDGFAAGARALERALRTFATGRAAPVWLASHIAGVLWDIDTWRTLAARQSELARAAGSLDILPVALTTLAGAHLLAGELDQAAELVEETAAIGELTGRRATGYGPLPLAAFRGREAEALQLIRDSAPEAHERGEGLGLTSIEYSTAVLYNGLGRHEEALAAADRPVGHPADLWAAILLPERVEAAVRTGRSAGTGEALERLAVRTRASGTDWGLGVYARTRALVSEGEGAERLHREAIERLDRAGVRAELARAHLLYGEWLRRERRRADARACLRGAHEQFSAMGMEAFAERAARELVATGGKARARSAEIGAHLFISARTVQFHLGKVFSKLGITSRTQQHRVLVSEAKPQSAPP